MGRNGVLSGLNTLLITPVSTNDIPEDLHVKSPPGGEILDYIWRKLTELLHTVENLLTHLADKDDEILPVDMITKTCRTVISSLPFVIGGLILLLCLYRCCKCCCCQGRGRGTRWMRPPGRRGGARIPRSDFEADPRSYFLNLRAGRPIEEYYRLK